MLPMFFMDWSGGGEYPQLEKAGRMVRYLSALRQLQRSSFMAFYPEGKPSEFVSWMFSEISAAERPPSEWELDPMEREGMRTVGMRTVGMPIIPNNVRIYSHLIKDGSKQVVVKADDGRGLILIEGYLAPDQPPVLSKQWPFKLPRTF
jgi:hypothetical protein